MTSKSDTACVLDEYSWNKLWFRNKKLAFVYVEGLEFVIFI